MASNVEPEEVQAILDLTAPADGPPPVEVAPRDFARPLRLGPDELEGVQVKLRKVLPEVEAKMTSALRNHHTLEMLEVGEVSVEGLFAGARAPLATLRFEVAGQPGWLIWDAVPALAAIEVALGAAEPPAAEPRELTPVEHAMLESILSVAAVELGKSLGLALGQFTTPQLSDDLGSWRDGGETADRRRLRVRLAFEGPGGPSELSLYLPGVDPAVPAEGGEEPAPALPRHLEQVRVAVVARLGQSDIPLADLLAIEVGDVIPLQMSADEPLVLFVEDRARARGVLGSKNGNLAVHVSDVGPVKDQE